MRIKRKRNAYIEVKSSLKEESVDSLLTKESGIAMMHEKSMIATKIMPQKKDMKATSFFLTS